METLEKVFAYNLRKMRGKRTQADFAEQLGVSIVTISRWESGTFVPQGEQRAQIAVKLGVPETALFLDPDLSAPTAEQAVELLQAALNDPHFRATLEDALRAYMPKVRQKK